MQWFELEELDLPPFGLVAFEGSRARVVVRGSVRALVEASDDQFEVGGELVSTWVEASPTGCDRQAHHRWCGRPVGSGFGLTAASCQRRPSWSLRLSGVRRRIPLRPPIQLIHHLTNQLTSHRPSMQ